MIEEERRNLRYTLRQARRKLSEAQQARAADNLRELVTNQDFYRKALQIAFYQSVDGEIDPTPLLKQALSEGKSCCLPTIPDKNSELISFARFNEDTVLRKNRWGIYEPAAAKDTVSPTEFDLVFVPSGWVRCRLLSFGYG